MGRLVLRNTVYAALLLWAISLAAFGLSRMVPGDVVLDYLSIDDRAFSTSMNPSALRAAYARVAGKRGFDQPAFYLSVKPGYTPAGLDSIVYREDRETVAKWSRETLEGERCLSIYRSLRAALDQSCATPAASHDCNAIHQLLTVQDIPELHIQLGRVMAGMAADTGAWRAILAQAHADVEVLMRGSRKVVGLSWLPRVTWHGTANQYHAWMTGLVRLKPLTSLVDGRDAWTKIGEAVRWTLLMNILAFLLALAAGMAIGLWSGAHDQRRAERVVNVALFVVYALPSFWIATLLITWLASGQGLSLFPTGGLGPYARAGNVFEKWGIILWHLTLPVCCMALGAIAYVSRQMKMSVVHQLSQPYVGFLRAQGIPEGVILRRHVLRNASFPMITLAGQSIPVLLSGSLLIEVIFSIPGMGRLLYNSIIARDWPVVFPILMISAAVTVVAYILTDAVYKWADPRIKTGMA
jgi:peptide/nickel transport system permease protein